LSAKRLSIVATIGKAAFEVLSDVKATITFLGEVVVRIVLALLSPATFRFRELFVQLQIAFVGALPVICLVTLLIGFVIAYLFAVQIEKYGGSIFIVDGVALAMGRELSPLIVATVVAGRSGSSFTAQIGSMKLNEELDAIKILGLSVKEVLVLPRVIALMIAMPFLVFVGDVVGIAGGMLISNFQLDIRPVTFYERLRYAIPLHHFYSGLIKAPFFALFIGIIGSRLGLNVERNARSVGLSTTATVVQSIVAVILLDAVFAIIYMELEY
ncbi:MAG: ABC transporter permease, partial [Bdellovibrionales bacterium]|nr:ABC transporter permease [Bdellovibrionales bacterium]